MLENTLENLSLVSLPTLYNVLIRPHIDYHSVAWQE